MKGTGCERIVTRGGLITVTFGNPLLLGVVDVQVLLEEEGDTDVPHRGEIAKFFSADRGWRRSGERARRNKGEPGSADLGRDPIRATERCLAAGDTDNEAPGLNSCVE